MSNEIQIKISSKVDGAGFKDTKRELHDVETAADKAGNAIAKMERDARGRFKKKIPVEFDIPTTLGDLPSGQKVKVPVEPDSRSVGSFFSKFTQLGISASGPASKLLGNHVGITVGVAAGVAAAPVLASAIGSALSAGAGAGVIGAGVALAVAGDKNLQAAGKAAGKTFMTSMTDAAKVFAEPARASLTILEDAGGRISKKWAAAFSDLRGNVVPFVDDIVSGTERISDAFTNVASASGGAALQGLGQSWKLLADGVGDTVEILADGGPQAADNLRLVSGATADLLRYTGMTLDSMNKLASNEWVTGPLVPMLREHYREAAESSGTFERRTQGVSEAMEKAAEAAKSERGALEALASELKAQSDPVFAIIKAQDDLAAAQKATSEATEKHGKNSAEAEASLQKQALAALSLEENIGKLGGTFDGRMTPAMRNTLRAAGVTAPAIRRLETQFREAKKAGDQFARTYTARGRLDLSSFRAALASMDRSMDAMDGRTFRVYANLSKNFASGGVKGAASGGVRSDMTWVGEEGPELVNLAPGSRVHSSPDSRRMAAAGAGGGGGGGGEPITVNLVVDGKVLAQATVEPTRTMVARQAGGNVQQFFGVGA